MHTADAKKLAYMRNYFCAQKTQKVLKNRIIFHIAGNDKGKNVEISMFTKIQENTKSLAWELLLIISAGREQIVPKTRAAVRFAGAAEKSYAITQNIKDEKERKKCRM